MLLRREADIKEGIPHPRTFLDEKEKAAVEHRQASQPTQADQPPKKAAPAAKGSATGAVEEKPAK